MSSTADFVEYLVDQLDRDCRVTYRKMFGEYALYSAGKVVALVCDDRLYVKPTSEGRAHIGRPTERPAYPGAKPSFLIEDRIEDGPWLSELVRITRDALPEPKPKKGAAKPKSKKAPRSKVAKPTPKKRG